jgi:diphthamide synthase (EF-2-diphthine--ammonia ligase)
VTETFGRVSIHGVREALLRRQSQETELPLRTVSIPNPCSNAIYEEALLAELDRARGEGITHVVFGDLFLEDIREYRERLLARAGFAGVFPLWGRDTGELAREMLDGGLAAVLVCVDPARLPESFAGREFDESFLAERPAQVDACGERGEFHTFARAGPMFRRDIPVRGGRVVRRDSLVFADLLESAAPDD